MRKKSSERKSLVMLLFLPVTHILMNHVKFPYFSKTFWWKIVVRINKHGMSYVIILLITYKETVKFLTRLTEIIKNVYDTYNILFFFFFFKLKSMSHHQLEYRFTRRVKLRENCSHSLARRNTRHDHNNFAERI